LTTPFDIGHSTFDSQSSSVRGGVEHLQVF
jgi:hypothetical protein